jgi:hypothetical protein
VKLLIRHSVGCHHSPSPHREFLVIQRRLAARPDFAFVHSWSRQPVALFPAVLEVVEAVRYRIVYYVVEIEVVAVVELWHKSGIREKKVVVVDRRREKACAEVRHSRWSPRRRP